MNLISITCEGCKNHTNKEKRRINESIKLNRFMYCSNSCKAKYESPETKRKKAESRRKLALSKFYKNINKSPGLGPDGDCWEWLGSTDKGYGIASYNAKVWQAHRLSYFLTYGIIDNKLIILHKCDNPLCINPEHLQQGTKTDNQFDMVSKNRHVKGSNIHFAKLKESDIFEIRKMGNYENYSCKEIENKFNITSRTISQILNCHTWKHVITPWDNREKSNLGKNIQIFTLLESEKFWDKLEKTENCWIWKGSINSKGYGTFKIQNKIYKAHRISYQLHKGTINPHLIIRHLCNNKICVNPDHLQMGTHLENSEDNIKNNLQVKGEKIHTSKLTENQVKEIKLLLKNKELSHKNIALRYEISKWTIDDISQGRRWKHITI